MTHFNYFVMPNTPFPHYYISYPSPLSLGPPPTPPPPPEVQPLIASEATIRTITSLTSALELTREELLAAGYEKKKRVWSAEEDSRLL